VKAAASWKRLVADIRKETGVAATISKDGAYRSFNRQKVLSGTGHHQYRPGYSIHGLGRCVDVYNWPAIGSKTLDRIAARHGWRRTIPTEPWHYQYSPNLDTRISSTPATQRKKKLMSDFRYVKTKGDPAQFATTDGFEVIENRSYADTDLARTGRDNGPIEQEKGESDKAWAARRAALIAQWKVEAERRVASLKRV
jgi:hypothetical protein